MIRGTLCLILVVLSLFLVTSSSIPNAVSSDSRSSNPLLGPIIGSSDPVNGTLAAFNASLAQFDLYTQAKASESYGNFANNTRPNPGSPPGNLTWFSNINDSQGAPVSGTGFKFVSNGTTISQSINWTLNIAKGSVGSITYLRFDWNGTLTKGTNARYLLYNATATVPFLATNHIQNVTKTGPPYPAAVQGGPPLNSTGGIPLDCVMIDECFDVSKYIGFNITLAFIFNSNSTGRGVKFQVSNIEVASTAAPFQSVSNFMLLNPTNSAEVMHSADLSVTYNSNVTYHKPNTTNGNLTHTWRQTVLTFYLPASYGLTGINLNSTALTINHPFSQGLCNAAGCTNSRFLALNMTMSKIFTSTAVVLAKSLNAVTSIRTTQQGVPTDFLVPEDPLQVQIVNAQGVNVTGSDFVSAAPQGSSAQFNQTFPISRPGLILDNFTGGLPTTTLGNWNVTGIFKNGYDYGILSHRFRLEQIHVGSLSSGGSNTALNLQGVLSYGSNNSAAPAVNGVVFAIDAGSPSNSPITTQLSSAPSNGLYISNLTLVNGIFTRASEPLVIIFTVVNATSQAFSGNVTIQHEWSSSQTHGVTVTFPLTLGDQPFKASKVFPYRADISFTDNGLQAKLTSLTTQNSKTLMMSTGSTPVLSGRQHTGIFKITVGSNSTSGSYSSSLESSPYAYVPGLPVVPSRYITSQPFTTLAGGTFSTTLPSSQTPILGSKRLVLFALARDSNGIVLVNNSQNPGLTDSTTLLTTLDSIGQVVVGQSVQATLHLTSNSSRVTMNITVNLSLQGSGIVQSQTVTMTPGATKTLTFPFTAPQTPGQYLVTFSSPQYAGIFATQTLQVGLLQNYLQILLPALIGLVAAIIVLGFYMIRKGSDHETAKEEKGKSPGPKPKSEPKPALPARNP